MQNVSVIGLGYIGLPTSTLLAQNGFQVSGVDINAEIVEKVNAGISPIEEPGLPSLLKEQVESGRFVASLTPAEADVFLLIVPTPFVEETKEADMQYVKQAAKDIAPYLKAGNLVVLESTSTVGATESCVMDVVYEVRPELKGKLHFAFCPERAIPGDTLRELIENDRVIGGVDDASTEKAYAFYTKFVKGDVLKTNVKTAELVKLTENSFRDVNIAFANEMSLVCDQLGLDVFDVVKLANHHPRVNIMTPGAGVGGHCIAIDPWFIHKAAPDVTPLIHNARLVNDGKPEWVLDKIEKALALSDHKTLGLMGLAYKPNVDDMRESPSLKIAREVKKRWPDVRLQVCEPFAEMPEFDNVAVNALIEQNDVLVMLTGHSQFKDVNTSVFAHKTLIDTCGFYK